MDGEFKPLNSNAYSPSYDVDLLTTYDIHRLGLIKLEIESDLHVLAMTLEKNGVTMDSPLVTLDGFPRSDVNIIDVRTARVKIIRLKNDLNAVINVIAEKLSSGVFAVSSADSHTHTRPTVPFAEISEILRDSPASTCGLQNHDRIISFGDINATNHSNLRNVALTVKTNEDVSIPVTIKRDGIVLDVSLVPTSKWSGQGLLGCRLTQI